MVNRREAIALGIAALASPFATVAQAKIPVVGLLWNDSVKQSRRAMLVEAMRDLGYADGRNIRFVDRIGIEGYGGMSESAEELARARVDLIVTAGGTATLAAAKATKEIPIVAITGSDLVKAGLAASLARPGGNVTGVSNLSLDLAGKRVQLMQELVRGMSRLGLLFAPESSVGAANLRETEDAARTLGLQTLVTVMRKPEDAEEAIAKLVQWRAEALLVVPSTMLSAQSERIAGLATKHRLPAAAGSTRFAEAGGTLSYGPDPRGEFVKAAAYAHRILTGAKAGDLPIDRASRFELVVNLRTAKAIGLSIPQSILLRASRVIE